MKKILILFLGGIMFISLFGCAKKYHVTYDDMNLYKNAKKSYRAGQKVKIYYDIIGTDIDYSFYVDGKSVNYSYDDKKGFVIEFEMPEHDISISCKSVNSMVNMREQLVLTFSTGRCGTDGGDRSTTYSLYINNEDYYYKLQVVYEDSEGIRDESHQVEKSIVDDLKKVIKQCNFEKWANIKNAEAIDGGFTSLTYDFGQKVSVSTGHMPTDGQQQLDAVLEVLLKYISEAK